MIGKTVIFTKDSRSGEKYEGVVVDKVKMTTTNNEKTSITGYTIKIKEDEKLFTVPYYAIISIDSLGSNFSN